MIKVKGFFSDEELSTITPSGDPDCDKCGLHRQCLTPKMEYSGEGKLKVLAIAESPGKTEDEEGRQLVGEAGQLLYKKLRTIGFDLYKDFWLANSVACRPPKNRTPTRTEMKCCKPYVDSIIAELKPNVIWLMGKTAVESYYMNQVSKITMDRFRGLCIPDHKNKVSVIPLYHPSYALRNKGNNLVQSMFDRDLDNAVIETLANTTPPISTNYEKKAKKVVYSEEVLILLKSLIDNPPHHLVFDYETTGLKPFSAGHRIACISFCTNKKESFAFPFQYNNHFDSRVITKIKKLWRNILLGPSLKIAQNVKYEDMWSRNIIGVQPNNWHWCTMNATHVLDNRRKFTGLKFQSLVNWGIPDYSHDINSYLVPTSKEQKFNRVMQAPLTPLLKYCSTDSLITEWLYERQMIRFEMQPNLKKAFNFIMQGLLTMADIQNNGICTNKEYYEEQGTILDTNIKQIEQDLKSDKDVKTFEHRHKRSINFDSNDDLKKLFFSIKGFKSTKETTKGNESIDAEVLKGIEDETAKKIIHLNKLSKTRSTYIGQFLREIEDDGRMHPFFDLHIAASFRSSAAGPNFQNIPVRDEEAKKISRSGIMPSLDNLMLDFDHSSMEVRTAAFYTKDPVLIAYINDPATDMHRDQAKDIWGFNDKDWVDVENAKTIRFYAKNQFVFPEFYGSYWGSCAPNLWDTCKDFVVFAPDVQLWEHLINEKIISDKNDYEGFEKHVKDVEERFWKKFKVFKKWQEKVFQFYTENSYVEYLNGFRVSGYMTRNQLINFPIQGLAFHCLLKGLIDLNNVIKKEGLKSKIIGQIHDSGIIDTYPPEKDHIIETANYVCTEKIREDWKFINVPLLLEWSETGINESWYYTKEVK